MRYYLRIADLTSAHGDDDRFAWRGQSPQDLAASIEQTLRDPAFAERWRVLQPEPDEVDASWTGTDVGARVSSEDRAQQVDLIVTTTLPHRILAHRLNLLIGAHWTLRDVR